MPRNSGTGVYSPPPNITATPLAPIESADWNALVNDVTATFNSVLQPAQGGTGQASLTGLLGTIGGMPIAGGTFTGFVTLSGDATASLHPVTKQQHEAGLATKANTSHSHVVANVTDYTTATNALIDASKSGMVVGQKLTTNSALFATTTVIPVDDTIPQNTEGAQFMTATYTPKFATSTLIVQADINISDTTANQILVAALFRDSTANAKAAAFCYSGFTGQGSANSLNLSYSEVAGVTTAITFSIRVGTGNSGTVGVNTQNGTTRVFGGVASSSITITEIKA